MDITVSEQKMFHIDAQLTMEQAREKAWDNKTAAFGTLSRLFLRLKSNDIKVAAMEKRLDPLWHVVGHRHVVFNRGREYRVPVADKTVQKVTVSGSDYLLGDGPPRHFTIRGVEHCKDDVRIDSMIHGLSGAEMEATAIVQAPRQEILELANFAPAEAIVVPPEVKASAVIQRLVQKLMTPYEADQVSEETIQVEHLHLLYHPVYAFQYVWEARGKKAVVELDAVSGEVNTGTEVFLFEQQMKRIFNPETLFDLGVETIKLVVPGGAITAKIVQAIAGRGREEKER